MTRRNAIILSILLLAAAAGVIVSGLRKERQWTPPANPRYLDPIYLEVPKDFSPIKPALGKEIEGKRSTYVFDPATPKIRFSVSRGGREYWLESELQETRNKNQEARVVQKGNSVIWNEIFPHVTARYDTYDGYVKETLVLADANAPRSFTFKLTPGADVILDDREGGYVMVKAAGSGEELFMLRPPQGLDARNFRVDYKYRLEKVDRLNRSDRSDTADTSDRTDKSDTSDRSYILTLYPASPEQFSDAQYPVSIDPSHQVVEWDEALVQVGQNCAAAGCGQDGDIIDFKPAGWNWGTAERREFVIVKVPKMSRGQREEYTRRTDEGLVQYAIDYTELATQEELSAIRDPKQISPLLKATDKPDIIKRKSELGASVIPQERRLVYQPPPKPSRLAILWKKFIPSARAATTVTSSIGTASRNYSTLQAWETAKNGNLVTADQVQKGEAYNDSVFNELLTIDGSTTDATRYMWLTVASGQRHNGTAGTGARINYTTQGGGTGIIEVLDAYTVIEWLEITGAGASTTLEQHGIQLDIGSDQTTLRNLIIHDIPSNAGIAADGIMMQNGFNGTSATVYNTIIYDIGRRGITSNSTTTPDPVFKVYNVTIYNSGSQGVGARRSDIEAKNVIAMGNVTDFKQDVDGVDSGALIINTANNMSSDATADDFGGTGHLISKVASNQFVSLTGGSENFHLKSGADAINAGTDLSATFTTDIDNQTRSGTWDMGADETNTAPTISSVSDSPDPVTAGSAISFSTSWSDVNGDSIKVKVCKTDALSAQNCTGGSWATSTAFTTTTPEAPSYTAQSADIATSPNSYYAFVCDTYAGCSSSTSGTFTVQSVAPSITSVTDTPDPTNPNRSVTFTVDWNDADADAVKVKVCKTDALSAQNCSGGFWASSTAFITLDPEKVVYDVVAGDAGQTRSYYVFVCDEYASCSTSTSGTFSVNAASTVPNVKFR